MLRKIQGPPLPLDLSWVILASGGGEPISCSESPDTPLPEPQCGLVGQGFIEPDPTDPCEQQRRHSGPWAPVFSFCIWGGAYSGTPTLWHAQPTGSTRGEPPPPSICCFLPDI